MKVTTLFLDFYGTLVEEDDRYIQQITETIHKITPVDTTAKEIGSVWSQEFVRLYTNSCGARFMKQREIQIRSLEATMECFRVNADAQALCSPLFEYAQRPSIYPDTHAFLHTVSVPTYIVSNIDTKDIEAAITYLGLRVEGVITSEDAQCYKPRTDIFIKALHTAKAMQENVIHVGDSWSCDVIGAIQASITPIWLNRRKRSIPQEPQVQVCDNLNQVMDVLSKN